MVKTSTVIKRMVSRSWKPALSIIGAIAVIMGTSTLAEAHLGWDFDTVYWSSLLALFIGYNLKGAYDWQKMEIKFEQEKLMRDLGKQND